MRGTLFRLAIHELKYVHLLCGMCIKHMMLFILHWIVTGDSFEGHSTLMDITKSLVQLMLMYVLDCAKDFVAKQVCLRLIEEMKAIVEDYYMHLGLDLSDPAFCDILYVNNSKHYCCRLPA